MDDREITDRLLQVQSIEAAHAECVKIAQELGFGHFLFGMRIPVPITRPCQLILSGYPADWRKRYDEQHYMVHDPILRNSIAGVLPQVWSMVARDTPRADQIFSEAAEYGLVHGITFPVHGAHGEFSLLSFAGLDTLPKTDKTRAELVRTGHWIAAHLHDAVRRLVLQPPEQRRGELPTRLSARERDCLRRAAEGDSAAQIAQALSITERTAIFHLTRCQEKLNTNKRQHAIARAIALGEIEPECYPNRLEQSERLIETLK